MYLRVVSLTSTHVYILKLTSQLYVRIINSQVDGGAVYKYKYTYIYNITQIRGWKEVDQGNPVASW